MVKLKKRTPGQPAKVANATRTHTIRIPKTTKDLNAIIDEFTAYPGMITVDQKELNVNLIGSAVAVRQCVVRLLMETSAPIESWKYQLEMEHTYAEQENRAKMKPEPLRKSEIQTEVAAARTMIRSKNLESSKIARSLPAVVRRGVISNFVEGRSWLRETTGNMLVSWLNEQTASTLQSLKRREMPACFSDFMATMIRCRVDDNLLFEFYKIGLTFYEYPSISKKTPKYFRYVANLRSKVASDATDKSSDPSSSSSSSSSRRSSTSDCPPSHGTPATGPVVCASTSPPDPPSDRDSSDEDRSDSTQVSSSSRSSSSSSTTRSSTSSSTSTRSRSTNSESSAAHTQHRLPRDDSTSPLASIRSSVDSEMDRDTILKCTGHRQGALPIVHNSLQYASQTQDIPHDRCSSPLTSIETAVDVEYDMDARDTNRPLHRQETMGPQSTPILRTRRSSAGSELTKKESFDALKEPQRVSSTESESLVPVGAKTSRRAVNRKDLRYELPDTYPMADEQYLFDARGNERVMPLSFHHRPSKHASDSNTSTSSEYDRHVVSNRQFATNTRPANNSLRLIELRHKMGVLQVDQRRAEELSLAKKQEETQHRRDAEQSIEMACAAAAQSSLEEFKAQMIKEELEKLREQERKLEHAEGF